MRRISFLMLLLILPIQKAYSEVQIDGIWYNLYEYAKTAKVTSWSDALCSGSIAIPSQVTYDNVVYSVKSIENSAFMNCTSLTSITIPNSVTSIGYQAFSNCRNLTSITIPNSVTIIGDDTFYDCSGLTSITVEEGNTVYDSRNNCNAIIETANNALIAGCKNTIIPNNITSIEGGAFSGCSSLTTITIPNSVTSIGYYAFSGCSSLTSITIPNNVTSIEWGAFSGCSGLTSITIPSSVTSIGYYAFKGCSGLNSIIVDKGNAVYDSRNNSNAIIRTEDNTLIAGCKTTLIPESVTSINSGAFSGCSGLSSITIPNNVTSIYEGAFSNCSSLTSITIPSSVTSIGDYAFSNCSSLTSITIPGVTRIGDYAFSNCSSLTSITIPGVTSISGKAFNGCNNLVFKIVFTDLSAFLNNSVISSFFNNSVLYSIIPLSMPFQLIDANGNEIKEIVIPERVTKIEEGAFYYCSSLTSITIPNSVTKIEEIAFYGCSGLTSITIPNSVTSIERGAFSHCSGLTSITVEEGNTVYDSRNNCNAIIETANNALIAGCKNTIIPNNLTSIEGGAFSGCSGLTSITIPNSVTSIKGAFYECSELSDIYCTADPTKLTWIGGYNEFKKSIPTICHVFSSDLKAYQTKVDIKVDLTFVGDLDELIAAKVEAAGMKNRINNVIYNLNGYHLEGQPLDGLFIKNGKKYIVK